MAEEIEYEVPSREPGGKATKRTARVEHVEPGEPRPATRTVHVRYEKADEPVDIREVQRRAREGS